MAASYENLGLKSACVTEGAGCGVYDAVAAALSSLGSAGPGVCRAGGLLASQVPGLGASGGSGCFRLCS